MPLKPVTLQRSVILLAHCPYQAEVVPALLSFIHQNGGMLLGLDQHLDSQHLALRLEWDIAHFRIAPKAISGAFAPLAQDYKLAWELHFSSHVPKLGIWADEPDFLYDLLGHWQAKTWLVDIVLIVSSQPKLSKIAERFEIPFQTSFEDMPALDLLIRCGDVPLPESLSCCVIDVQPDQAYDLAYQQGFKQLGATSRYVLENAIIEQDSTRISHQGTLQDILVKGKALEKVVLARAIQYHLQHRIVVNQAKTIVFA